MSAAMRPAALAVSTLVFLSAMGVALVAWWPIYEGGQFVILAVSTALLAAAIAILGALYRWSSAVVAGATIAVFALAGPALAVPGATLYGVVPTLEAELSLFSGVALGWKQLLTIALPVGSYQSLLVPVFALELLAVVVGLSIAVRARRAELATLAPVVVFIVGLAFGPERAHWPLAISLGLLAVVLFWLVWRRWYRRRSDITAAAVRGAPAPRSRLLGLRAIVSGLIVVVLAGAGSLVATALVPPAGAREVLRSAVQQAFDPRDYPSPLVGFRAQWRPGTRDAVLFTVSGLPEGARIRIATLDSYDGIVFSLGGAGATSEADAFTRVPYRFDQSGTAGEVIDLAVVIGAYSGVWLPTVGKFESVVFSGADAQQRRDAFFYNDTSGTAAVLGGLTTGDQYRLEAVVPPQPTAAQLERATPGSAIVPPLTALPAELPGVLERYSGAVDGAGAKLMAAVRGLRSEGYVSHGVEPTEPPSRSGHSADRITQLLSDQRMIGDAEQYSVTAAIMARELGFPSRVVYGFEPQGTGQPLAVTGAMVSAWIEVDTAEYGWVAIDVTPPVRDIPEEQPEEPSSISRPPSVVQPPAANEDNTDSQSPIESTQDPPPTDPAWIGVLLGVARVLGWSLLVIAVISSPFVVVIAAKLRRRQLRRTAPSALQRMSGGWREVEDAMLDHGYAPAPNATRSEVAQLMGGETPRAVATVVDRAVFAPSDPAAEQAEQLWRDVDEVLASLDEGATRWQRWRARVSVRSLDSYRVRSLLARGRASR